MWQIDLLENPTIEDVVLLSAVLDEVNHKSIAVFKDLGTLSTMHGGPMLSPTSS